MIFGKMKSLLAVLALALLLAPAAQAAPAKLSSAWMGEHETFVAWYAKQQGWDKEAGLDLTMMPFDSGKNIVESLRLGSRRVRRRARFDHAAERLPVHHCGR